MPRETMQDLRDKIDGLMKQNQGLVQDRTDYFDRMTNAEIRAEQAEFERDEVLKELDTLKAELETAKAKLKEARATARKHEHELNDLKRKHKTARNTIDIQKQRIVNKDAELEALKAANAASVPNMGAIMEQARNPRRGRPSSITPDQRQRVQDLHAAGGSVRTIARETGLSVGSVQRILHGQQ